MESNVAINSILHVLTYVFRTRIVVGGTSILYRIKLHEVIAPVPTHEFNVESKHHHHSKLTMWDVGGGKKLRHLWNYYYPGIQVVFYVVDAHNKNRLEEAKEEFDRVLQDTVLKGVPVLILANKQDLNGALSKDEISSYFGVQDITDRYCDVIETSARINLGLTECLDRAIELCKPKS
ncbi:hypothetical protein KUTeg_008886 [Tegillarca granosa]|uniref:Uncharacterized protein n=1 Tax=Tegillarca granosa TaxID=220873 RepID=A0ABQ9FF80_TEGGR|nr:hypothetical protein KUTeg_008886 [Tegillarca granosa]